MALADEFVRVYKETRPSDPVVELRLYDVAIPEIDLDLLSAWKKLAAGTPFVHLHDFEQNKATLFDNYTEQFLAADRVVIANPLWNPQVPTRLKAWIDTITRAGKTFNYGPTGEPMDWPRASAEFTCRPPAECSADKTPRASTCGPFSASSASPTSSRWPSRASITSPHAPTSSCTRGSYRSAKSRRPSERRRSPGGARPSSV